ncbi:T cell receptor gamma variable 11 (non-functional) [Rhinolophus ferrumequinum]|nr:T cell receptor gamma variable 11 (non-functional) [Rhinolophus ferrumequinum]
MQLLDALIFSSLWAFGFGQLKLEQPVISICRTRDKSAYISCKMSTENINTDYIHWYRQKPDQGIEHLLYVDSRTMVSNNFGGKKNKLQASKSSLTSTLTINFLEQEDEAIYYCACWSGTHNVRAAKATYTTTIFRSVPTHILLSLGNHRGGTAGHPA